MIIFLVLEPSHQFTVSIVERKEGRQGKGGREAPIIKGAVEVERQTFGSGDDLSSTFSSWD